MSVLCSAAGVCEHQIVAAKFAGTSSAEMTSHCSLEVTSLVIAVLEVMMHLMFCWPKHVLDLSRLAIEAFAKRTCLLVLSMNVFVAVSYSFLVAIVGDMMVRHDGICGVVQIEPVQ